MKIRGIISKEMAEIMKRREILYLELGGSWHASKLNQKEKKKKMVLTFSGKGNIILLEMDKFQQRITGKKGMLSGPNMSTFWFF